MRASFSLWGKSRGSAVTQYSISVASTWFPASRSFNRFCRDLWLPINSLNVFIRLLSIDDCIIDFLLLRFIFSVVIGHKVLVTTPSWVFAPGESVSARRVDHQEI
jgi:hypothetical protein